MKLSNFKQLPLGYKLLTILGVNIVMIIIFGLLMFGNASTVVSGVSNQITVASGFSIFNNMFFIFVKVIIFVITFIIVNILMIANKLTAAIITLSIVVLLMIVASVQYEIETREIASELNQLSESIEA